jgi:hypothetical protein
MPDTITAPLTVEEAALYIYTNYGYEPYIHCACRGGADEHWQFRRNPDYEMPEWVLIDGGMLLVHPG